MVQRVARQLRRCRRDTVAGSTGDTFQQLASSERFAKGEVCSDGAGWRQFPAGHHTNAKLRKSAARFGHELPAVSVRQEDVADHYIETIVHVLRIEQGPGTGDVGCNRDRVPLRFEQLADQPAGVVLILDKEDAAFADELLRAAGKRPPAP